MQNSVGLQYPVGVQLFLARLIVCVILACACFLVAFDSAPLPAWANTALEYGYSEQTEPDAATSSETPQPSVQAKPKGAVASLGEQLGPWHAIQNGADDELLSTVDNASSTENQSIQPVVLGLFGMSLAGVVIMALMVIKAKWQKA